MQVLKPAQVAPVSTKAQKISMKIIIDLHNQRSSAVRTTMPEEDIDFINMPSQIPFSDDNCF